VDESKATASDLTAAFERLATAGPPERPQPVMRTACVPGSGIAGLLAARVLSGYADQVIVLERDPGVGDERPRAGVPQGRPVHTHLVRREIQCHSTSSPFASPSLMPT
jgi:cation diffusion facilitator CzcD-associated flavoprotein CzcO